MPVSFDTSIPTAFMFSPCVVDTAPAPVSRRLFNLLVDASAPNDGSTYAYQMLRARETADRLFHKRVSPFTLPSYSFSFDPTKDTTGHYAFTVTILWEVTYNECILEE